MTSRRGQFTINLAKRGSREEAEALPLVLLGSPDSLAEASEDFLVEAHSREGRTRSTHLVPGVGSEAGSTQRIRTRSLSEYISSTDRVIDILTLCRQFFGGFGGFGGMGSMPGMGGMGGRGRGASMFDDDDDMGPFNMPGGMHGRRPGTSRRPSGTLSTQPGEISKPLPISLEDLYQGVTKRMKVSRRTLEGEMEEKVRSPRLQRKEFNPDMSG